MCLCFIAHLYSLDVLDSLVLMIHTFWLVFHIFDTFFMFMLNFMYMSILSKLLVIHILEPLACMHILLWTSYVWICMYTLVCTKHTYTLKNSCFDDLHVFKEFHIELICPFSWGCVSHNSYTLTLIKIFSWFYFHEYDMCLIDFECWWSCDLHVFHEINSCFIPYLKDFVLVYKSFI